MKTQILVSIGKNGLQEIALIAEKESECREIMETYERFESEILNFLRAIRERNEHDFTSSD